MERNSGTKVSYSLRYGSDFPHSVPAKGKDMDQAEPNVASPVSAVVPETKSEFEGCPQTDADNSLPSVRLPRKRKGYRLEASAHERTMLFDCKRIRHDSHRTSRSIEVWKPRKGGSCKVDTGLREKKIGGSKHIPGSACLRAPFHLYDEQVRPERVLHLGPGASETSIASSDDVGDNKKGGGNRSRLTSNEEGKNRLLTYTQAPKMTGQANNRFRFGMQCIDDFVTGTVRQDATGARHLPPSGHRTSRWKHTRESRDGEVISGPLKKSLSSYAARDSELNRVFGVGSWKSQYDKHVDERREASGMYSGCSDDTRNESSRDGDPDVSSSKLTQACAKYGLSNSSREHQSSSVLTELCVSSGSVSLWLEGGTSKSPFQPFQAGVTTNVAPDVKDDEKATAASPPEKTRYLLHAQDEKHTTTRSQYTTSRPEGTTPASNISERDIVAPIPNMPAGHGDSRGSGGSESSKPEPTFVLSSGRLSKTQEAQLGKRPTTIDDDFDQYFAQLML